MRATLCEFVLRLYRGSREREAPRFMDWALDLTRSLIAFDSAVWGIGVAGVGVHSIHLHHLPAGMFRRWESEHRNNAELTALIEGCGAERTHRSSISAPAHPDLLRFCRRYDVHHALCTTIENPVTHLHHFLCLYRGHAHVAFSAEDQEFKAFLAPHLVEARDHNLAAYFGAYKEAAYRSALCDRFGLLHQMEPGFTELLQVEWPEAHPPYLPAGLNELIARHRKLVFEGDSIVVKTAPLGDLVHLQAKRQGRSGHLSPRQRLITKHLILGETYKEIARALDISPSTVMKHVNAIYKKTGARNRMQLARLIERAKRRG
ncbi:MAG: helix-turn-helix transcriptional regulator [Acidiferrobacteraceae bacterium]